jgi:hypothetical protein
MIIKCDGKKMRRRKCKTTSSATEEKVDAVEEGKRRMRIKWDEKKARRTR